MLKRYCDICKVELDGDEQIKEVKLPNKNLKICTSCLKKIEQPIESESNNFKIEVVRHKRDCASKWRELC